MSTKDWEQFISLIPDEQIITEGSVGTTNVGEGFLLLTNKRLIFFTYAYKGVWSPKKVGLKQIKFEVYLNDIESFRMYEGGILSQSKLIINVQSKPSLPQSITLFLKNNDKLKSLYKNLSTVVMLSKEPKTIKQEVVRYNISTKFQFGKDGGLVIECPNCGASSPLTSKRNLVKCSYCGKEYIVPKKLLDLI
ncbi:MAG: hypothetical protein ACETVR_03055 [Candidatus Bathyarchaeia archaeon]